MTTSHWLLGVSQLWRSNVVYAISSRSISGDSTQLHNYIEPKLMEKLHNFNFIVFRQLKKKVNTDYLSMLGSVHTLLIGGEEFEYQAAHNSKFHSINAYLELPRFAKYIWRTNLASVQNTFLV